MQIFCRIFGNFMRRNFPGKRAPRLRWRADLQTRVTRDILEKCGKQRRQNGETQMKRYTPVVETKNHGYLSAPFHDSHLLWKARYLAPAPAAKGEEKVLPQVSVYRLDFELKSSAEIAVRYTGLERYDFFLDGRRLSGGPERGDVMHLSYESFRGVLEAGRHRFSVRVWSAFDRGPNNQMKHENCFILEAEGKWREKLSTGSAPWECRRVKGLSFPEKTLFPWCVLDECRMDLSFCGEDLDRGEGDGFVPAPVYEELLPVEGAESGQFSDRFPLYPAQLPAMMRKTVRGMKAVLADDGSNEVFHRSADLPEVRAAADRMLAGEGPLRLNAGERRRVVIDLGDYYCAFPRLSLAGEGEVKVVWTEAFYRPGTLDKDDRGEFEGKELKNIHYDIFVAGGAERAASALWFRAGKYVVLELKAGASALELRSFSLEETHYPLEIRGKTDFSDPFFGRVEGLMVRVLEMCMHEVYFDCPFYEQMMYVGDTRLQSLVTYVLSGDARLPHRALRIFDWSRTFYGMSASCYPTDTYRQTILSFSLICVAMLRDAMFWSEADALLRDLRPGMHMILDYFERFRREDDLIVTPPGWNFSDWCTADGMGAESGEVPLVCGKDVHWICGVAPGGEAGNVSSILNLFYLYALDAASEIERFRGENPYVELYAERKKRTVAALQKVFFDAEKGAFADDAGHGFYSEHAQILALLTNAAPEGEEDRIKHFLFDSPDEPKAKCTIGLLHYYFDCCRIAGRTDRFFGRQEQVWGRLAELHFSTTPEMNEPSRSDCHAWGAHPLYHWRTLILGMTPVAPGMTVLEFRPQLGKLEYASGTIPSPHGEIFVEWIVRSGRLSGKVVLPPGVRGVFVHSGGRREEFAGERRLED